MNVDIASRLAALRKKYGYSQESLAEQLGISRQAVSKWERAEASPDTDNLITLANLYGVSLDDLLNTGKNLPEPPEPKEEPPAGEAKARGSYGYSIEFNDDADFGEYESAAERAERETEQAAREADQKKYGDIHIEDKDSKVHIGLDGIRLFDKDGTKVNINWKGVHVETPDDDDVSEVHVSGKGVYVKNSDGKYRAHVGGEDIPDEMKADDYENWEDWVGDKHKNLFQRLPLGVIAIVAFLLLGFLGNLWHPGWMVFLLIPVVDSFITAISKRDPHRFAYPVLAFDVFLWIGFMHNLWHPGWVLFLTIPIYYAIFPKKKKKHLHINVED